MSDIEKLREEVEKITADMLKLLKSRTDIAKEIGNLKSQQGRVIADESRENELRNKMMKACDEIGFDKTLATRFLNFLFNESVKVQSSESQTHLTIFLKAKELEREGKNIIHLEVGEPDFKPPESVQNSLLQIYNGGFGKYGPSEGIPEFRDSIATFANNHFDCQISSRNVMVVPGARFGVFLTFSTLLNYGDEVIIIEPAWPAYRQCAINSGIKIRAIKTKLEDAWEPSLEDIKSSVNNNTKMIVLNYPNNPTGKILSKELQDSIFEIAKDNNLFILSDEIYSNYSNKKWKSALSYNYEKTIVTQSFSKSHSMTGYRIGYVIGSNNIIEKMAKLQSLCLTNVSEPIQFLAMKSINDDVSENARIMRERLGILSELAQKMNLEFEVPDGAMYIFARTKSKINTSELAEKLLEYGLAIAPGNAFGDYQHFFRLSACVDKEKIIKGMDILKARTTDM
ncbi:MAG: aminotransferase class I/II-fold pyridoxal phosphate-dependent enzyme [Thermoproteota archaeon]|nr:aminotransferase class I/II-fold pyridoxal phosphate-dependent enzyme [Thermoproteota archaeon]